MDIYTCKIEDTINDKGYIVPGLGDAGDLSFGEPLQLSDNLFFKKNFIKIFISIIFTYKTANTNSITLAKILKDL